MGIDVVGLFDSDGVPVMRTSDQGVTATGTAGSAVTLTIPSASGQFHYITSIVIQRAASAALAGTGVLVITTTNLPGSPAWTVGNAVAVGQGLTDLNLMPTTPIKSSATATATTIVCPAPGAGVLWRVTVSYYLGL